MKMIQWRKGRQHWDTEPSHRFHPQETRTSSTVEKKNVCLELQGGTRASPAGRERRSTVEPPHLRPLEGQERAGVGKDRGELF